MAIRQTTHVLKNSDIVNRPLPSSLLPGEPIVNTADGIMYFSGVTTSSSNWTRAGTGATEMTFFEVGSNLYDLKLRNRLTQYEGISGGGLTGKFLSGTTNGFVLADISNIQGVDRYITGSTFTAATNNTNTQYSQLQYNIPVVGGPYFINTEDTFTTGGTYNNGTKAITFDKNDATSYTVDLSSIDVNDTYVTGGTNTAATTSSPNATINLLYNQDVTPGTYTLPYSDVFLTGFTYSNNNFTLLDNSGNTYSQVVNNFTGLTINGNLTVTGNTNLGPLTAGTTNINGNLTVTGTTSLQTLSATSVFVSGFVPTQVVYVGSSGELTGENAFTYTEGSNTLNVENIEASGDVVIQGDLTVFGAAISAFTSNLYVEDPNITLNYNPTGSTTITSVNAGITIQDGNGVSSGDVNLDIVRMQNLTGLTSTEIPSVTEYTGLTGYSNRGWITQLNDIVIRSTDPTDDGLFNGVRVLGEFDVLDGGVY